MQTPTRPSEAAIDAFLARGGDMLATTDAAGHITWCNAAFQTRTGCAGDAAGVELAALAHPETDPAALDALRHGFDSGAGVSGIEIALAGRDAHARDEVLWCLVKTMPVDAAVRSSGFACVLHDRRAL
ncbi:MAG: hypothetical protein Q7T55_12595, partial [Solirubrobacteraceae bacterium]|nr:hypothetical protein [Solirubrobacteraceae bacterium]